MNMKFICTRENLLLALDGVGGAAGKQVNLPILLNILIQADDAKVSFASTNLEIAIRAVVRAKVEEQGSFTVPAKTLADYAHLLSDEQVEISVSGNELQISCGNSSTKMKGAPAADFPVLPDVEDGNAYGILVEPFREALAKTVVAAAKNDIRPELSGVYFGFFTDRHPGLAIAATDSYRLAEKKLSVAQGDAAHVCIVPARTVYEMARLLGFDRGEAGESQARLSFGGSQLLLRYGNFELTSRLIDGTYPDYAQIIPSSFKTTAVFPADVMTNRIKAASLFSTTGVNAVSFDLNASEQNVGVSSVSTQKGEHSSSVDAEVSGEENSILLNHRYVLDGLAHMAGDVELCVNSADSPCLLREKGKDDYVYIVMPIRQ